MSQGGADPELSGPAGTELEALLRVGEMRLLPASSILCAEGLPANHCFVITEGTVEVTMTLADGERTLSTCGPGSILALMTAVDGGPCRVSMRARVDVKAVEIAREGLLDVFGFEDNACPTLADKLTITSIRRLRRSTDELALTLHRSLTTTERPGHLRAPELALIHAGNHAWKSGS
jgi:CRP-like cAMP-binding protein